MAGRGTQSFKKRQKEQQRKEKQEEKRAKRFQRKHGERNPETGELIEGEHQDAGAEVLEQPADHSNF